MDHLLTTCATLCNHASMAELITPVWTLGERLAKARRDAELTQKQLATEIDVGERSISAYENDEAVPKLHVLVAWALRCGVRYSWLVDDPNAPDDPSDLGFWMIVGGGAEKRWTLPPLASPSLALAS